MIVPNNPKIILAGSVNSSLVTLKKLIQHKCNLCGVLALEPMSANNVSGYVNLKKVADKYNIPCLYFKSINEKHVIKYVSEVQPDLLFVIGLSQLVREPLISIAKIGNIGFHPTMLPEGRGRGAIAWMILGKANGAATFFLLDKGMDSGPIIGQKKFEISNKDYASDIIEKIKDSMSDLLDDLLPKIKVGIIQAVPQEHSKATFLGRRKPEDGKIDWTQSADSIHRLIRATSHPLPGAFTIYEDNIIIIQHATIEVYRRYFGVPGRILEIVDKNILVACNEGAIWIDEYNCDKDIKFNVGSDFK